MAVYPRAVDRPAPLAHIPYRTSPPSDLAASAVPGGVSISRPHMSDADAQPKVLHAMGFFDGQNLFRHAKEAFGYYHPNYDVCKLHAAVCAQQGWTSNLIRFYTGVPSLAEAPMWAGYWSNRVLAMKRAGVFVTTRDIRYQKTEVEQADGTTKIITTPHEKGIDVRLALDVVSTARKRQYDVAVIYSQD